MLSRKIIAILAFLLLTSNILLLGQKSLPRSTPEAEGVSSSQIIEFLDAAAASKCEFHSYMILRHGKVIAEGWWSPYEPSLKHTLYSCSKSFTATAIGFAVHEKLLNLSDKVISFFPDDLPDTVSAFLKQLTVKDVLIMSDGQDPDPTFRVVSKDSNWVKGFLATPIVDEPGTRFLYNSLGTYMLSAIIHKVSGQPLIDYLKPRLFEPLGIEGMDWETDTRGINTGGWGLRVKTEDMAKFAQLFLQKGRWYERQLLPASWVEEASSAQIMQNPEARQSQRDSSDWMQGYGYQMWRSRNNAYRGDGAFGQYMIVMPEQDAVVAITAETPDMQEEINLVWDHLLPAFKPEPLPENSAALSQLRAKEKELALPPAPFTNASVKVPKKTFALQTNDLGWTSARFKTSKKKVAVQLESASGSHTINFRRGRWKEGETNKPGPTLVASAIANLSMIYPTKVAASYSWKDTNALELVLRYVESPHTETLLCRFEGDEVVIDVSHSFNPRKPVTVLHGKVRDK